MLETAPMARLIASGTVTATRDAPMDDPQPSPTLARTHAPNTEQVQRLDGSGLVNTEKGLFSVVHSNAVTIA